MSKKEPETMPLIEAARILQMSPTTLRRRIVAGEIKAVPTPPSLHRPKVSKLETAEVERYRKRLGV